MTISILSLHTYPVKSCGGITHTQVGISTAGLSHDRQWVIVDDKGVFLTQRTYPSMALVQPALDETALFLNAPEMPTLRVSLRRTDASAPATPIQIWQSDTLGLDEGDTAAHWFSDYLGFKCRLYRVHPEARRLTNRQYVELWRSRHPEATNFPTNHAFGFADGFPILFTNQASLEDLNRRLAVRGHQPVEMNRFRPNIVIQGLEPYEEDFLSSVRIGTMTLAMVKRCIRCQMPNVNPGTGEVGSEPMTTLGSYRSFGPKILFGVNAVVFGTQADSVVSVGELLEVTLDL